MQIALIFTDTPEAEDGTNVSIALRYDPPPPAGRLVLEILDRLAQGGQAPEAECDDVPSDEEPKQVIVCAACRHGETVLVGPHHWDNVMRSQYERLHPDFQVFRSLFDQGFLDQFGEFISRVDAYKIAEQNGQSIDEERNGSTVELYSEGLY